MNEMGRRNSRVSCNKCKRRQLPCPRIKPYEKGDNTCEHHSGALPTRGCLICYFPMQENDDREWRCVNPECRYSPVVPAMLFQSSLFPPQSTVTELETISKAQSPSIHRTHCRNCRLSNEVCSGLILGLRCQRCETLDLECDCKVLRKSCEECMKTRGKIDWKRCAGFRDECDACMEKGIECKEYVREPGKEVNWEKRPQDVVADGKMDVIDGMKAIRAFAACERCLEKRVKCDEKLPSCGGCRDKGVECEYRLLMATISGSSRRRFEQRRSSLSLQEKLGDDTVEEKDPLQSRIRLACNGCRKSRIMCSKMDPCGRCEELGLSCTFISTPGRFEQLAGRAQEDISETGTGIEDKVNQLEGMMSNLELEDWHLVSREEIEEIARCESGIQ